MNLLLEEAGREPFRGSIVTLGRMHTYFTAEDVRVAARRRNVPLTETRCQLHSVPELAAQNYISDESLYEILGFSESVRIDIDNYEGVDILIDLNTTETPEELLQRFDVVLDFGTLEHVFHVPNCLAHLERMVKPGGRIIQLTPTHNAVDHGFYSISPTLYADYYGQRGYHLHKIYLCRLPRRDFQHRSWRIYDYLNRDHTVRLDLGRLDASVYFTFVVAEASNLSAQGASIPQQAAYLQTWKNSREEGSSHTEEPAHTKAGRLLAATQGIPIVEPCSRWLIRSWRKMRADWQTWKAGPVPCPYRGRY